MSTGSAWRTRADPRMAAYLVAGFGALVTALVSGRGELAAIAAPFLFLAALGLRERTPANVSCAVSLAERRVLAGDVVGGEVRIVWDGEAEVEVLLCEFRGVQPAGDAPLEWRVNGRGPAVLTFELRTETWGRHEPAVVWVRVRRPGAFLMLESKATPLPTLHVLPAPLRLDRLLQPREPRALAGAHRSRLKGTGTDFAELRPYQPGDRLRDLSWATSARMDQPWVTVRHSERAGTVLLLLDTTGSTDGRSTAALARTARAAWAIAATHLRVQDRVGLLATGRTIAWLPPRGGRRARWALLDLLLAIGTATAGERARSFAPRRRWIIPADALIVAVTTGHSRDFTRDLLHYRRAGHVVGALVLDEHELLTGDLPDHADTALRIWRAQRDAERFLLERGGVATALVSGNETIAPAVSALRRRLLRLPRLGSAR